MNIRNAFYLSTALGLSILTINTINNQIPPNPGECRYKFDIPNWNWYGHCRADGPTSDGHQEQLGHSQLNRDPTP